VTERDDERCVIDDWTVNLKKKGESGRVLEMTGEDKRSCSRSKHTKLSELLDVLSLLLQSVCTCKYVERQQGSTPVNILKNRAHSTLHVRGGAC
jgi:hypothetical protein